MPTVMQRFNHPPVEEWDPSLLPNINFGFAESHEGGDSALRNQHDGSFGLISGHNVTDQIDRETVKLVAPLVERQLDNANFDFRDPEVSMRNIFRMAQSEVKDATRSLGPKHKTRIDMSLIKVYVDPNDQRIKAAYGHSGRHSIIHAPNGEQPKNIDQGLNQSTLNAGIGIPPLPEEQANFGIIDFDENDRLILQSRNAAGYEQRDAYSMHELSAALRKDDPEDTAKLLIRKNDTYENRSAIVIVAPPALNAKHNENSFKRASMKERLSQRGALIAAIGTVAGLMMISGTRERTSRLSTLRNRFRNRDTEPVVVDNSSSTRVVSAEDDIRSDRDVRENKGWPITSRRSIRRDHETRRSGGGRKVLKYGALAVGAYLAMRYAMDLGDGAPHWLSGRPDTGIDFNPRGSGDLNDGNRTGWDFNPSNENLAWNDDPVNPNFKDTGGIDFIPQVDGDWFSANSWDIDWPNGDGEPGVDFDGDGDVDAPNVTIETPDTNLDAPNVSLPEVDPPKVDLPDVNLPDVDLPDVDAPDVTVTPPPAAPPVPSPPAIWTPDTFTIEPGHGLIKEIHDMGHEVAGFQNFTDPDSTRILELARDKFGDNLLNLPSHPGNDLYRAGDDLRISAPGPAHWQSQEIERFIHEEMEKLVKAKK